MKLLYEFEYVEIGDEITAVPVGDSAEHFHGVLNLNESGADMLKAISESETPEQALEKLCAQYPDDDKNEIGQNLCDFMNQLIKERILIPQ